jgi:hypothetical protein
MMNNKEMDELRKIVDLFDGAGFTIVYFLARYYSHSFTIVIKSGSIVDNERTADDYKNEQAGIAGIVTLFEKTGYEIIRYEKKWNVVAEYSGTIYLEIVPRGKGITP